MIASIDWQSFNQDSSRLCQQLGADDTIISAVLVVSVADHKGNLRTCVVMHGDVDASKLSLDKVSDVSTEIVEKTTRIIN